MEQKTKNFLKRMKYVKHQYLYSQEQIRQKKQIETLFKKIDEDESGGLDKDELISLYNKNGIPVDSRIIRKCYGDKINLTL